jgi:phosphatidylinositol 4-kinase A
VAIPFEIASPHSVSTGIDAWTWIIAERPELEVALMSEILSAWSESIRLEKGIFSTSLK